MRCEETVSLVTKIENNAIIFDDGHILSSHHEDDCCETHELYFRDLELRDFDGIEFDLSGEAWFRRVPDYGIRLIPVQGHPVSIAGHGANNGYYSDNLTLRLSRDATIRDYDVTECQLVCG